MKTLSLLGSWSLTALTVLLAKEREVEIRDTGNVSGKLKIVPKISG